MRYAKYKPTGIAWLPEVPEGWKMVRCKCLFTERIEKSETGIEEPLSMSQKMGIVPTKIVDVVPNAASSYVGAKKVYKGDIVFNKLKAHLGVFAVSSYDGLVSPDYAVYESTGLLDSKLIEYLFHTALYIAEFKRRSRGVAAGFMRLYSRELFAIPCVLSPLPTQRAIVAYLDEKCGKVDRLVVAKEKEAALLKELKQSMIAEAVTRGVRPKRRLVPSGIPWLPEVPEGWKLVRNKTFLKLTDEKVGSRKNAFTLLSLTKQGVIVRDLTERKGKFPKDFDTYLVVRPNNLVFCLFDVDETPRTVGLVKNVGMLTGAYTNFEVDQSVVLPEFAYYYYLHVDDAKKLRPYYTGLRKVVKTNTFMQLRMPVPSLDEQREIVAHIEARAAKIDAAVAGLEREVAALKEYKQRLIADVVTGKRKVA